MSRCFLLAGVLTILALACNGDAGEVSPTVTTAPAAIETDASPTLVPLAVTADDRLIISAIGVDAPLVVEVVSNGQMPDPRDLGSVALYDWSELPEFGGQPGTSNTVVAAPKDTPNGPGPFFRFNDLAPGHRVDLRNGGTNYQFTVVAICSVARNAFDPVVKSTNVEALTLVSSQSSNETIYAVAERQPNSLPKTCPAGSERLPGASLPSSAQPSLTFVSRISEDQKAGPIPGAFFYRFTLSGHTGPTPNPNQALTIHSLASGSPAGFNVSWGRSGSDVLDVGLPAEPRAALTKSASISVAATS